MSATRSPDRFRRDNDGVSEVVGYLFSFVIAVIILVASMATFRVVSEAGDQFAAHAEFEDIANRVAAAVLDAFELGAVLRETHGTVTSGSVDSFEYTKSLDVPAEFRGYRYTVTIDNQYVYVESTDDRIAANSTTFKADEVLAPTGTCNQSYIVCAIEGSVPAGQSQVDVRYLYDPNASPFVNKIVIS